MRLGWIWSLGMVGCGAGALEPPPPVWSPPVVRTWFVDEDGDGFGEPGSPIEAVDAPGRVLLAGDCDDTDPRVHPNAIEIRSDGIDQDCDGIDATCTSHPDYPGDLVLTGERVAQELRRYCTEFSGIDGALVITRSDLTNLDAATCFCRFGGLELVSNRALVDATALAGARFEGAAARLVIEGERVLERVAAGFQGAGSVRIAAAPRLAEVRVEGLVHADRIELFKVPKLTHLPFPELVSAGTVELIGVPLESLELIGTLSSLESLSLVVGGEPAPELGGLEQVSHLGALVLDDGWHNALPDWSALHTVEGDLQIVGEHVGWLQGLEGVRYVGGDLVIASNPALVDVSALHGAQVKGEVVISDNPRLSDAGRQALITAIAANRDE